MNTVTASELAKRMLGIIKAKPGEAVDLSILKDGSVLLRKAEQTQGSNT